MPRCLTLLVACLVIVSPLCAQEPALCVPPGFKVTRYADHTLANDIYAMTLDDRGRVIVSSRGWVKLLLDTDNDGKADTAITIHKTETGATGLCWDDGMLYLCADGWFSRLPMTLPNTTGGGADAPPKSASPRTERRPEVLSPMPVSAAPKAEPRREAPNPMIVPAAPKAELPLDPLYDRDYLTRGDGWYARLLAAQFGTQPRSLKTIDVSSLCIVPGFSALAVSSSLANQFGHSVPAVFVGSSRPVTLAEPQSHDLILLAVNEHGGHAMRKGPDGRWYMSYGDRAEIQRVPLDSSSPIKKPAAGGILRFSKNLRQVECIAQGLRDPRGFDFTPLGDIITCDGDTDRDSLFPWYAPTSIYHVGHGQHHGSRTTGDKHSPTRPAYYADIVDRLAPIGRGVPTGVVCYRHYQFPLRYRGGVFALDWEFGKIWFVPLAHDGSSYTSKPQVFLEPIGSDGFTPTAACVAPDGSLFVSTGGRGTRGAVYRIEYVGTKDEPREAYREPEFLLSQVLAAPQPLDAWSRAKWEPLARKLGRDRFLAVIGDQLLYPDDQRVRAIEIITDLFHGLTLEGAHKGFDDISFEVNARTAWSLGRTCCAGGEEYLLKLASLHNARVRLSALDAIGDLLERNRFKWGLIGEDIKLLSENLKHRDKRVRQAAGRVLSHLSISDWNELAHATDTSVWARMAFAISDPSSVFLSRKQRIVLDGLQSAEPALRLDALRLLMLIDGDWCLHNPPDEVSSAYVLQKPRSELREYDRAIRTQLRQIYPSGHKTFDHEAARYLAMIEDNDPATIEKVISRFTKESAATDDLHHLIVLTRLRGKPTPAQTKLVVDALLGLDSKLAGQPLRSKQDWGARLADIVFGLMLHYPKMTDTILNHPAFVRPAHAAYSRPFATENRIKAARLFLDAVKKDASFVWSAELIELLATLPPGEYRPLFRRQWADAKLHDAMLRHLVDNPEEADRACLLDGLDSAQVSTVLDCIAALQALPRDQSAANLVLILRRLRLSARQAPEYNIRDKLVSLLNRQANVHFVVRERTMASWLLGKDDGPVFAWFDRNHPAEAKRLREDDATAEPWRKVLASTPWDKGNPERGLKIARDRSCLVCHTGGRTGPELANMTGRFSRDDLFMAIISPHRDVAHAYRVDDIKTLDGKSVSGLVDFESADVLLVQLDAVQTVRIDTANIASRQPSRKSLMPAGLLNDLKPAELADLYSYLSSLISKVEK